MNPTGSYFRALSFVPDNSTCTFNFGEAKILKGLG